MSGILDVKSRILDTIITAEGRKQLAEGGINIKYVTYSDGATYYKAVDDNVTEDVTRRIYLENCHLPQDQLTFLSNPDGKLSGYANDARGTIRAGKILQEISGSSLYKELTGQEFIDEAQNILSTSISNFEKLNLLSSSDFFFDDQDFSLSHEEIEFSFSNGNPFPEGLSNINIRHLDELYSDNKLSNIDNFKYLPPINKIEDLSIDKRNYNSIAPYMIGNYLPWNNKNGLDVISLLKDCSELAKKGQSKILQFDPTSRNNQLFMQFFELTNSLASKLDVIDFGNFNLTNNQLSELSRFFPEKNMPGHNIKILFVGKVVDDKTNNSSHFMNIFTLIFG